MAGLAMTAIAAPMAVLGSAAARLRTTRVRIAVGLVIVALLATVSLPPPMAVAASDVIQVEHRAWSLSYEEWKQLRSQRLYEDGEDGDRKYLSEEEVFAAREKVQGQIEEYCGS